MSNPISPIETPNKTVAAQAKARIRDAIIQQVLKSGERIDQTQLADALQISIVPVREALQSLEAEGLVTIVPRRGAFVTEVSIENLQELYLARELIEGETTARATELLSEDDLVMLTELVKLMDDAIKNPDLTDYLVMNKQFHMRIYQALNNEFLIQTIQNLWERCEIYRFRSVAVANTLHQAQAEHHAINDALQTGDAARAKDIIIKHISTTYEGLRKELEAQLSPKDA